MKLDGTLSANLRAAILSAQRLRGHPVHKETMEYWGDLLAFARLNQRGGQRSDDIERLIGELESELAERS